MLKFLCPKCGEVRILVKWLESTDSLRCQCQRCEYAWFLEPADRAAAKDIPADDSDVKEG